MKKQLDIKACPKCGFTCARMDIKALEEYFGHRGSILQSWCKVCRRVQTAEKRKEANGIKTAQTTPVKQPALKVVKKKSDLQKKVDKNWIKIAKQEQEEALNKIYEDQVAVDEARKNGTLRQVPLGVKWEDRFKALDKRIEQAYYRTCSGVQINVMDISKVFAAGRAALEISDDEAVLEQAIISFVETIRCDDKPQGVAAIRATIDEKADVQLDIWEHPSTGINRLREIPEQLEALRILYQDQYPNDKCKVRAFKFMANRLIKRFGGLTKVTMSELCKAKLGLTGKGAK